MKNSFVYFIGGSWDGVRKTVERQPHRQMYVLKLIDFDLVSLSDKDSMVREEYEIMAKDYFEPSGGEIFVYKYIRDC
jgi:hypothetical protein